MSLHLRSFRTLRSLKNRNFRLLVVGSGLSNTGDFVQDVAQSWLVWELTHSAFLLGLVAFCDTLPRLILGPVGGVITDRVDRRRLLVISQTLAMLQAFVLWLLVYAKAILIWQIILLVLFLGVVNSLNQTARQSLINSLVPRDELLNAIALHSSVFNLTRIVGPSIGGILISIVGTAGCFFINGLSFVAIIVSLLMMDVPPWQSEAREQIWRDITEGYRYIRSNRRIFTVISLSYVVAMVGSPYSRFLPVFASDILHVGPSGYGFLMAAPGFGALISALYLASLEDSIPRMRLTLLSVLGFSLFLLLFAFSRSMALSLLFLIFVGSAFMAFRALANVTIQLETPPHLLGRILSFFFMDKGLWSLGTLVLGGGAHLIGAPWTFALSACVCGLATAAFLFRPAGAG